MSTTHFNFSRARRGLAAPKRRLRARAVATLATLGATFIAVAAHAAPCPLGSYCYYAPPLLPQPIVSPQGFAGDFVLASPSGTVTGTYAVNGGAPVPFSVTSGTPVIVALGMNEGITSGFNLVDQRGIEVVASSPDLIVDQRLVADFWQSSSTVKSNVVGLGTRFRAGGYALNTDVGAGDGTNYDFLSFFAPTGATITIEAPPGAMAPYWQDGIAGLTHAVTLQAGDTYMVRTVAGLDIDGALVTSDNPVSVAAGGRGWSPAGCGDDGMDHLVPTNLLGTQFVVDDYPSTAGERVRVVTDSNATDIFVDGTLVGTINAGEHFDIPVTGVTFIETSQPAYVFQNAGLLICENDLALIPPVVFAQTGPINVAFDVLGSGAVNVVIPTASLSTLTLDGAPIMNPAIVAVPLHPEWSRVRFDVMGGTHNVSADSDFQLGLVSGNGGAGLFAYYNPYRLPGCGDGVVGMGEGCDDGNVNDADGCSAACQVEATYQCTGQPSVCVVIDSDNDGVIDGDDNCVNVPNPDQADADMDGIGDACEADTDMDGVIDDIDNCVNTPNMDQADMDMDGIGDACEADTDMDGVIDDIDNCINVPNPDQADTDMDGVGNACEPDTDMDGVIDDIDNCVNTPNMDQADMDMDGIGDACDIPDADNDGIADDVDNCPMTPNMDQADTDMDGIGDACEADTDMDGIIDDVDNCVNEPNMDQADMDMDGVGDACEGDVDSDGIVDDVDNCINVPNMDQADTDMDGIGDACEADTDMDGVVDDDDNCVNVPNMDQADTDMDGIGDACEADTDMDGVVDDDDNCVNVPNMDQADADMDGIGDACEADADSDGVPDDDDNCINEPNADQADADMDGIGDACDTPDADGDGIADDVDNCLMTPNADQADADMDGIGDACDTPDEDNDGIADFMDNCPSTPNPDQLDADIDGVGDVCDADGIIIEGGSCACRQAASTTGDVGGGAMAAFGAFLLGLFRRRRKA
ncbi:MAG: thrombospondin type 3 repeat-containing protein [Polyangiaceae bacterium]|nr:thrombospondin type 3 repeat-containing protein [Polyangiaceae bacterium]